MSDDPSQEPETNNSAPPVWMEWLDHTADTGILVVADDLPTLFARAAWAMFSIITDPNTFQERAAENLEVDAEDPEALLVNWLSELNYRHVTRHVVYNRFEVLELTDHHLSARVWGEPIDLQRHVVHTEIKAVTFHGLALERINQHWRARVIFDL